MAYASGKFALAISDRSGLQFPYTEMVREWTGAWVHTSEFTPKAPQLMPHEHSPDPQALQHARPARIEPVALILLPTNPFETYASGSQVINVHSPNNDRSTGDTVRFRGMPFVSSETNKFNDCAEVDGITGAVLCAVLGIQLQLENTYQGPVMDLTTGIIFPQVHQQLRLEELEEEVTLFQQVL